MYRLENLFKVKEIKINLSVDISKDINIQNYKFGYSNPEIPFNKIISIIPIDSPDTRLETIRIGRSGTIYLEAIGNAREISVIVTYIN